MESLSFNLAYERLNHPLNSFTSFVAISFCFYLLDIRPVVRALLFLCMPYSRSPSGKVSRLGRKKYRSAEREMISPRPAARPCAPVGNGYLCFKEISVSFSASYHPKLSPGGEKGCLPVTPLVRFAARLDFFIFFASGTLLRTPETLSGIICPPFRL